MAKNIIDENVVITSFDVDEGSEKVSVQRHRTYSSNVEKIYRDLNTSILQIATSFNSTLSRLEKNTLQLEKLNQSLINSLDRLANKYKQTNNTIQQTTRTANNGFNNLFNTIGKLEQAIFRLSAGFFTAGFTLSKMIDDQRDLFYLSQKLNIPVDEISRYSYVVSQIGGDAEKAKASLNRFSQTLQDTARGQNAEALEIFGRLGISQFNSDGSIKTVSQTISEIKERFEKIESTQTKVNYLKKLGFDENEFNYFLQDISLIESRFDELYEKLTGVDAGSFLDVSTNAVKNLSNEMRTLGTTLNIVGQVLLYKLLPSLNYLVSSLQTKILTNSRNINNTLLIFGEILVKSATLITSLVNMVFEFTGALSNLWYSLEKSERHLLTLGMAFVGFFKLFSTAMLSSPFGRFITLLTMGLMLIQDYVYWKKQMAGENYAAHYNWSEVDKYVSKVQDWLGDIKNPFEDWNFQLKELLSNFDAFSAAVLALIAVMTGKKIPMTVGSVIMSNPKLTGIAGLLMGAGYLVNDHLDKVGTKEESKLEYGFGWAKNLFASFWDKNDLYKNTDEGKRIRQNTLFENPELYYDRAAHDKKFADLIGMTQKEAYALYQQEKSIREMLGGKKYLSSDMEYLRRQNFASRTGLSIANANEIYPVSTFNNYVKEGVDTTIPNQNLGGEKIVNNNTSNNVNISKGDTTITINGNVSDDNIEDIKQAINNDNDFFNQNTSFDYITNNANQVIR